MQSLSAEAAKVVAHVKSLGLAIPPRGASHQHVGAIIADAVLQVGHGYETHVRKRIRRILKSYSKANTLLGLSQVLQGTSARTFLDWKGEDVQDRFLQSVMFFQNEKLNTFDDLRKWLKSETNRDRLISNSAHDDKAGIPRISDATADYYRVLVRLPDAVKVDSLVKQFVKDAGVITRTYAYKQLRSIVQLAAGQLGVSPVDLEGAVWNYQNKLGSKGGKMPIGSLGDSHHKQLQVARGHTLAQRGIAAEAKVVDSMPIPAGWKRNKFILAGRGAFTKLWGHNAVLAPAAWNAEPRFAKAFADYLQSQEGISWQHANPNSGWISAAPSAASVAGPNPQPVAPLQAPSLTISLSQADQSALEELADRAGVTSEQMAQVLVVWHLR